MGHYWNDIAAAVYYWDDAAVVAELRLPGIEQQIVDHATDDRHHHSNRDEHDVGVIYRKIGAYFEIDFFFARWEDQISEDPFSDNLLCRWKIIGVRLSLLALIQWTSAAAWHLSLLHASISLGDHYIHGIVMVMG